METSKIYLANVEPLCTCDTKHKPKTNVLSFVVIGYLSGTVPNSLRVWPLWGRQSTGSLVSLVSSSWDMFVHPIQCVCETAYACTHAAHTHTHTDIHETDVLVDQEQKFQAHFQELKEEYDKKHDTVTNSS